MRTVRVTVDIPEDEHFYFKMACARLKTTLKTFLLEAGEKRLEELENEWLAAEVDRVKERITKGEETFEPLENVIKDLGLENEIPSRTKQHRKKVS
jgi:predicted DNA-binding protein